MRVDRVRLERFKRFSNFEMVFDPKTPVTLLVGDNGTGKSTILQAIAFTLGTATTQLREPSALDWPGFMMEGLSANHRGFFRVALDVAFEEDELAATREYYTDSDFATSENATPPGDAPGVQLIWDENPEARYPVSTDPPGPRHFFQFQGRRYAYNLLDNRRAQLGMFDRVGGVFFYNEQRTAHSLTSFEDSNPVDALTRRLVNWFAIANVKSKPDAFNALYSKLFPGRKLARVGETFGKNNPPVYFSDGRDEYDVFELSAGERAVMPLLLDFVEWNITHSVILIDELELHLHPPLQQAVLTLLPRLGKNNQFIVTTHSDHIANLVPESAIKRVVQS